MKTILFVDDHEVLARLSCEILEMQGYRAVYAFNAYDALAKFEHSNFDMLITDFRMEGMNGLELARFVRQRAPGLPVIIVSGYPQEESDEVSAWMEKQNLFPALLDKIRLFLGETESEEALRSA
jgi:CheY-like chemotaxis protein